MIAPFELSGAFQGEKIAGIGHDTDDPVASLGIAADLTKRLCTEMETALALPHLSSGGQKCIRKTADLLLRLAKEMQCKSLGRAGADTWKPFKLVDQPSQWTGETAQGFFADKNELRCSISGMDLPRHSLGCLIRSELIIELILAKNG